MDDLISRQAAKETFAMWHAASGYSEGEKNIIRAVINVIDDLPSAKRKKSRWKKVYLVEQVDDGSPCVFCCENCENVVAMTTRYCSGCGAYMWDDEEPDIVRCEECKYYKKSVFWAEGQAYEFTTCCNEYGLKNAEKGEFCSRGERREG